MNRSKGSYWSARTFLDVFSRQKKLKIMGIMENDGAVTNPNHRNRLFERNVTLFWRVFIPVFGTVFLAGLTITLLIIPEEIYIYHFQHSGFASQ
ncbi:MAG: hypothetical protein R2778_06805 [Saprospiraceae bacterium]